MVLANKISIDLKFKMLRVFNSNKYKNLDLLNQFKILSKIQLIILKKIQIFLRLKLKKN